MFDVRRSSCRELPVARSAGVFMFRPNEDNDYFIKRAELGLVFVVPRTESDWRFSASSPSLPSEKVDINMREKKQRIDGYQWMRALRFPSISIMSLCYIFLVDT